MIEALYIAIVSLGGIAESDSSSLFAINPKGESFVIQLQKLIRLHTSLQLSRWLRCLTGWHDRFHFCLDAIFMAVVFTRLSMGMATFGINLTGVSVSAAPAQND
jgi:hypothetical protein